MCYRRKKNRGSQETTGKSEFFLVQSCSALQTQGVPGPKSPRANSGTTQTGRRGDLQPSCKGSCGHSTNSHAPHRLEGRGTAWNKDQQSTCILSKRKSYTKRAELTAFQEIITKGGTMVRRKGRNIKGIYP